MDFTCFSNRMFHAARPFWVMIILFGICFASPAADMREVWVSVKEDVGLGSGTKEDPFNAKGADGLDKLFVKLTSEYGENLKINFAPGTYFGTTRWKLPSHWIVKGAGIDKTVFKTSPDPKSIRTVGFRDNTTHDTELSDFTFDFNISKLRRANRVFLTLWAYKPAVRYFYLEKISEWQSGKNYYERNMRRTLKNIAVYEGLEYIAIKKDPKMLPPKDNKFWRRLYPVEASKLDAWNETVSYKAGVAVSHKGKGWISFSENKGSEPDLSGKLWQEVSLEANDPRIYTQAAFIGGMHGEKNAGNNKVIRIKAINCNGSRLFDKENFVIGIGGCNSIVKDCIVDKFHGDYATLICMYSGVGNKVSGCQAYGNGMCFAYGGWGMHDATFENNYAINVEAGVNIDSLANRNVTFRNNMFKSCHRIGILVNVAYYAPTSKHYNYSIFYKGKMIKPRVACMDNLLVEGNLVEMVDGAPWAAVQVQSTGMHSAIVRNNILTKTAGNKGARAIGLYKAQNVSVLDNVIEPGMTTKIQTKNEDFQFKGNRYADGKAAF